MADVTLKFDLRTQPKKIIVVDELDYNALGWNIDNVTAVITFSGPSGTVYSNTDHSNPDIVPSVSRELNKIIALPLDPETDYENVIKGNYTLKIEWKESVLNETKQDTDTYQFDFDSPEITNKTVSGPYSGILTSTDTTDYGGDLYSLTREHRISYPTQLIPTPNDIVSSQEEVSVSPIYTNKWTIKISVDTEYRFPDTLIVLWSGERSFSHCVYGSCIDSMYDAIKNMLITYEDILACNLANRNEYERRLIIINNAWHLLNIAYKNGDTEEADNQAAIISEQIEYSNGGDCGGQTSYLVTPCPPYSGGGATPTEYTFENALTLSGTIVRFGGQLIQDTNVLIGEYLLSYSAISSGYSASQTIQSSKIENNVSFDGKEGGVTVSPDGVVLSYSDLSIPSNTRKYIIGNDGLTEDSDYTTSYVDRSLVAKSYVDGKFFEKSAGSVNALSGKASLAPGDLFLIEDSEDSYNKKKVLFSSLPFNETFLSLTDTISSYSGRGGEAVIVNSSEDGLSSVDLTGDLLSFSTDGQINGLGNKASLSLSDVFIIEDSADSYSKKKTTIGDLPFAYTLIGLSDTPSSYGGFGGYFVKVKSAEDGIEFIEGSGWVSVSGGTFSGNIIISNTSNRLLTLQHAGTGTTPGIPEASENYLSFQDGDGDEQGYTGINNSGDYVFKTNIGGASIKSLNDFYVEGDITLSGIVDGVDIAAFKSEYDSHTHTFASITSKPTTLSGYGIIDAMSSDENTWATEFTNKSSADTADYIVVEDSADSRKKKYIQVGNLPTNATTFLALTDTPSSYTGAADYVLRVNSGETAMEFVDLSTIYIKTEAGTLNAKTLKSTLANDDVILIEDSADSYKQKKILASSLPGSGGPGDMTKAVYDTDNDGVVDDSEKLGGQSPSYYLDWANVTNKPTDITDLSLHNTDELYEGSNNLYYTDSRVSSNSAVSANTAHRSATNNPHQVAWSQLIGSQPAPIDHATSHITSGDDLIPSFNSSNPGLVPVSDGDASHFLRSDGTWVAPVGTTYSFSNGLTESSGTVELGGSLTKATTITLGTYSYNIKATGSSMSIAMYMSYESYDIHSYSSANQSGNNDFFSLFRGTAAKMGWTNSSASKTSQIAVGVDGVIVTDQNGEKGMVYAADYSANGVLDDRWIPDYKAVKDYVASVGGGMVYPGAGIAVSTGSAWGTSIPDNHNNWDSAYTHSTTTSGNPHHVDWSELYGTQPAPISHASSHESGGSDEINHDNLAGFVANEHIDWTTTGAESINISRIPVFTSTANGLVPSSSGGTTNFLRADGVWEKPIGDVGTSGTPAANQLAIWTDSHTIEGNSNLTYDGSLLNITSDLYVTNNLGIGTNPDIGIRIKANQSSHGSYVASFYYTGPAVSSNATNYDILQRLYFENNYNIASGVTDSGYRMGMDIVADVSTSSLVGTLSAQYGLRIQYGHYTGATGGGTINEIRGIYLNYLTGGNITVGNVYSIYSAGSDAKMYHQGIVGIAVIPDSSYKLNVGGTVQASDFKQSSDRRLKKNIVTFSDINIALGLRPVLHSWKNEEKMGYGIYPGFITQEVEKVMPSLVTVGENGFQSLSYSKITAINNAAIHELYKEIQDLKKQIKRLKDERT